MKLCWVCAWFLSLAGKSASLITAEQFCIPFLALKWLHPYPLMPPRWNDRLISQIVEKLSFLLILFLEMSGWRKKYVYIWSRFFKQSGRSREDCIYNLVISLADRNPYNQVPFLVKWSLPVIPTYNVTDWSNNKKIKKSDHHLDFTASCYDSIPWPLCLNSEDVGHK